jgi:small subunit ribosomal protein S13
LSVSEYKHIIRIAGKDIEGGKKIVVALSEIRGIGYNLAQVILQSMNVNAGLRIGFLTDKEIAEIETVIKNPSRLNVPSWYLNRQKDMDSGGNNHLITSDLDFAVSEVVQSALRKREKLFQPLRLLNPLHRQYQGHPSRLKMRQPPLAHEG